MPEPGPQITGVRPPVVDLHLHTTASDGALSPSELIRRVAQTSLQVVAVTDHDSTDGVDEALEAAGDYPHLTVIPGVEIGTENAETRGEEVHLTGYFLEYRDPELLEELHRLRNARVIAAQGTVEKLRELGVDISWERVREIADGAVGRPHIARAMAEAGYVEHPQQAFERYLGDNGIARVKREKPTPSEGIRLIHRYGGACSLAHPQTVTGLRRIMGWLVDEELDGIEVFAPKYGDSQRDYAIEVAKRNRLIPTGGSDYHAWGRDDEVVPGAPDVVGPPLEVVDRLREAAERWKDRAAAGRV